jgi:hypothetical protein
VTGASAPSSTTGDDLRARLLDFLHDEKEIYELFMVVDEELKMMCDICTEGGQVLGPFLKPMSRLIHTEYLLAGRTDRDPREVLRDTMYAATVTGSPVENACRLIKQYETEGRGYYGAALAVLGRDAQGGPVVDSPIVIRTADVGLDGRLKVTAGATLVRDSDPAYEVAETHAKAGGILSAFGLVPPAPTPSVNVAELVNDEDVLLALNQRNRRLSSFWLTDQAGAPPDDFAIKGQNWAFPTYNWKKMQEDHFEWWRRRFQQMSNYFDAFRIDHVLGFFRIWSIPVHAVEGIMGHFVPAIPVYVSEFGEKGIWFDYNRYCKPFITDHVLEELFGSLTGKVKAEFINTDTNGGYELKPAFDRQRKVEKYFAELHHAADNEILKNGLFNLISNVILFEEPGSEGKQFHFRIAVDKTSSFRNLDHEQQQKLNDLYVNYFYKRQDEFWKKEAMHKLPYLKRATNMLICGEDLGMVPDCVPDVMKQIGILSLEIQRMPKNQDTEFFHPDNAPYLSVITPSTHDMSTIRGWWEENRTKTISFYHSVLGQWGEPPFYCEPWINRAIVLQHLVSPAMWSVFQLQDILGMSEKLRKENPQEERINTPADPENKWKYRMHLFLEELIQEKDFNNELFGYIEQSGR